jgi:Tfp pilus assembly protein PilF
VTTPDDETTASAESAFNLGLQRVRQGDLARAAEAYHKAIELGTPSGQPTLPMVERDSLMTGEPASAYATSGYEAEAMTLTA